MEELVRDVKLGDPSLFFPMKPVQHARSHEANLMPRQPLMSWFVTADFPKQIADGRLEEQRYLDVCSVAMNSNLGRTKIVVEEPYIVTMDDLPTQRRHRPRYVDALGGQAIRWTGIGYRGQGR
jgi:hypothetical protein